jgi:hypothetical protein
VVHRQDVYLVVPEQTKNDSIWTFDNLPDITALEFRNYSGGLCEVLQAINCPNQPGDDDRGVVWRICSMKARIAARSATAWSVQ